MTLNFNYNSLTTGIINYLARNSSTVDSGLSNSVSFIGDFRVDEFSLKGNQLPGISVDLVSHTEDLTEWNGVSYAGTVLCIWEIGVHTRLYNSYTALQKDLKTFVQNVEFAIRSDATLSGTFDLAQVTGADFGNIIRGNAGSKQKNGLINLQTTNFVR